MTIYRMALPLALFGLLSCSPKDGPNLPATFGPLGKIEGPDVKTLSHDELMAVLHECHRYGSSDNSRVKYTINYCSTAQSAHSMEGYSSSKPTAADPQLNKLH